MKRLLIALFLVPIFVFAYPIYDEEVRSHLHEEGIAAEEQIQPSQQTPKAASEIDRQKRANQLSMDSLHPDSGKKSSFHLRSEHLKRHTAQGKSSSRSKFRHRQNPNRPRVTHRDPKKQPQKQLPQMEADAEDVEQGLSVYQQNEGAENSEAIQDEELGGDRSSSAKKRSNSRKGF